jgi:alginate O-acetyltransferase complex protein AlgJ
VDSFLSDNFGFRDFLINRYYKEIRKRFGISGVDKTVLEGREGWLYFIAENQLQDFQGKTVLSEKELTTWIDAARKKHDWLKARGIRYLLVIAPNKQSIYPEFMPGSLPQLNGTSRFQQLRQRLQSQPLDFLVDLHTPMLTAKSQYQLFHKTDTHWNHRGAFVGYLAIIRSLQERFPNEEFRHDFHFGQDRTERCSEAVGCDLALMARSDQEVYETYPVVDDIHLCRWPFPISQFGLTNIDTTKGQYHFSKRCQRQQIRAVIFRDSFMNALEPFLSENFKESIYLWKPYDQQNMEELLNHFTPDLVVEEVVERDLFKATAQ